MEDKPNGRGEIAGMSYEMGRPNLPRLCQAFFPSDTEVSVSEKLCVPVVPIKSIGAAPEPPRSCT
jgi:hypothetical protein